MKRQFRNIIIAVLMLAILSTALAGCSSKGGSGKISLVKIDSSEYVSKPVFSGCNGYGTATIVFNEEALIVKAIGEEPAAMTDAFWEWVALYDEYSSDISIEYNKENLSNGDTVVVKINVTGTAAKKIKSAEMKYKVEGLSDVEYVDVFKSVDIQFSGISGEASAKLSLTANGDVLDACKFSIEPSYGLKNGDVVTVTITNTENLLNKFCALPKEESKTFIVSGLEYYATAKDLPMDIVRQIGLQLVSEQQKENDEDPNFTYSDVELYGIFFLEGKEDAWADENQLHFVIHYNMLEDNGEVKYSYYTPLYIKDILVPTDGNISLQRDDCVSLFFYDSPDAYTEKYEYDYNITKIG